VTQACLELIGLKNLMLTSMPVVNDLYV